MNKEEQIKRLAQNLFNNGFTKSMDHAVQTAAKMLGFPDTMLINKLMREEEAKYGTESLLNGGYNMANSSSEPVQPQAQPQERQEVPEMEFSKDQAREITRSMAEERVYSQIPSSIRDIVGNPNFSSQQQAPQQQPVDDLDMLQTSTARQEPEQPFQQDARADASFDYSQPENPHEMPSETLDASVYENFIESTEDTSHLEGSFISDLKEEEQSSLLSGYQEEYEEMKPEETSENIFKGAESKNENMDIHSRFAPELGGSEDFFTVASETRQEPQRSHHVEYQQQPQQPAQQAQQVAASASSSGGADSSMAEAQVDLASMFDFRNMKS